MSRQPEKSLARRGAFLLIARIFPALALLLVMVGYSRMLSPEAYGQYQNVWVRYGLLSTLACLGIPTIAQVIGPVEMIVGLQRNRTQIRIGFGAVLALTTGVFLYWNRAYLPLPALSVFFVGWVLATVAEGLALGQRRYRLVSVVNLAASILFLVLHGVFRASPVLLFSSLGALALLRATCLWVPMGRVFRKTALPEATVGSSGLRRLWRDLAFYDLIQQSGRLMDKALVGFLVVPALSAVYFNGAQEVPFLPLLLGVAGSAFLHQAADAGATDARGKAIYIRATGHWLAAFVFPLFWFLMLERETIFDLVFGGRYAASVPVFAMATLILPLRAYPFSAMLQHFRETKWVLWGAGGELILATLLALIFYQLLGLPGIALAFVVSTLCMAVFYTWKTMQITHLQLSALLPLRAWALQFGASTGVLCGIKTALSLAGAGALAELVALALSAIGLAAFSGLRILRKKTGVAAKTGTECK